jgi:phage-related protein
MPRTPNIKPILEVVFYKTSLGNEPVREWLLKLGKPDKTFIGQDIKTAQYGWPLGMPLIRKLEKDIWEVRTDIKDGIARTFFTVIESRMVLLHGFIKKSQETPEREIAIVRKRLSDLRTTEQRKSDTND